MTPQKATDTGRKTLGSYLGLSRSPMQSYYRAAQARPPANLSRPPLEDFDNSDIWPWITNWLKATYQTDIEGLFVPADQKCPFEPYPTSGEQGRYDLSGLLAPDGSIRIAIAGDWGTGTDVAQQVAESMVRDNPELTIHLGDVYYVGMPEEVKENCLGEDTDAFKGVKWPKGSKGSFALNGNHEMYSGGHGYFENFLPTLGIPSSRDGQQLRSYFCLETPGWRLLALDTGYNSDTLSGDCTLEQVHLDWIANVVDPIHNRKPTVLLSHHQWFSGFGDGSYEKPANQIAGYFKNQEVVWLWGHEHRLAVFNKYKGGNHLTAWARCIGHGGMPLELPDASYPNANDAQRVEYWDGAMDQFPNRFPKLPDGTQVGTNGYVELTVQNTTLTIEYLDADGTSVLKESFAPGGGASWDGTLTRTVVSDPGTLIHEIWQT
jgi:hypothetical protein